MALVSATEGIAAITAMAGAEKSEWQSVRVVPLQSGHLMINAFVLTAAVTVVARDPRSAARAMENSSFWSTSASMWNGNVTEMIKNTSKTLI